MPHRPLHALTDWPIAGSNGANVTVGALLDVFAAGGHDAYVCGGAVRDALAGDVINDVDIAVDSSLPRIREIAEGLLGEGSTSTYLPRFGVLKIGNEANGIDIAMLRTPDDIRDARTLADVSYARVGTLEQDARNRDLTINSGYWSQQHGFVDPLGCTAQDIRQRQFGISADARKVAIDPRLSFRCLLFQARGYRMHTDALRHVSQSLGRDMQRMGEGLREYLHTLVRGSPSLAAAVGQGAKGLVEPAVATVLAEACAHVGRR